MLNAATTTASRAESRSDSARSRFSRSQWIAILAKASLSQLETCVNTLGTLPTYAFLRSPEIGLTMVRGRAEGTGQPFNLGEMTITRCVVQLVPATATSTGTSTDVSTGASTGTAAEAAASPGSTPAAAATAAPETESTQLTEPDALTGFGYVAGRSPRQAELAAVCDALLQQADWCDRVVQQVIEPLQATAQAAQQATAAEVEATRVNFFTLLRGDG